MHLSQAGRVSCGVCIFCVGTVIDLVVDAGVVLELLRSDGEEELFDLVVDDDELP